ncbi:hypothetical protein [Paracoccus sp. PAR01]|uniref:hypothetical protein n=1 Tax=Paracoccus sp. PAR01 TaxID=2769282 RepID=UPI0017814370|nr:hypothetical protein [Paracoccus sp. PAR01]MBD9525191.1 hypothetical protein [Paracoccus sp. PAR01]
MEHKTFTWKAADSAHRHVDSGSTRHSNVYDNLTEKDCDALAAQRMRNEGGIGDSARHSQAEVAPAPASSVVSPVLSYTAIPIAIVDPGFQRETDRRDEAKREKARHQEYWSIRYCALGDG